MRIEGGCYCTGVRYVAEGDPLFMGQCHCRECQYISGGQPNVVMGMPGGGFTYTKGSPKSFTRSDLPNPVGTFDDPRVFTGPQIVIYTIDKQPFHHVPEGVPTFETRPGA